MNELEFLGAAQNPVDAALHRLDAGRVVERIWQHDHTVWKPDPAGIADRLGWLHVAEPMRESAHQLAALVEAVGAAGTTRTLLLGMGGASLAPDLFGSVLGSDLAVIDTTAPDTVLHAIEQIDPRRTLLIVASKSGATVETLSLFKAFYDHVAAALGPEQAGAHFIAITDPGSRLADLGERLDFLAIYRNDPNIGGRYSALSFFGLVPAALAGVDVPRLLDRAIAAADACGPTVPTADNPAAWLGAALGGLAAAGRDKLTLLASPAIAPLGDWIEQLVAESTGKEGVGILPVVREPLGLPAVYGNDRLFVYLRLDDDGNADLDAATASLAQTGHPVIRFRLRDLYDLGRQFFVWELAVAVAGHLLGINPFDQPNVEAAKVRARAAMQAIQTAGGSPEDDAAPPTPAALTEFLTRARPGDYVALQAFVPPNPETTDALRALQAHLRDRLHLAVTVGYGPRFLHSTGQLHKGDGGNGLFVQFTADDLRDLPIPDEPGGASSSVTFGVLKTAQALGDRQALRDAGRRVIHFHLGADVARGLGALIAPR